MKIRIIALLVIFSISNISAQELINVNPDPKGEPWYVGKLRKLSPEDYKKIEQTPKLKIPKNYQKTSLPASVNNSLNKYFRPIFNQENGSCGQASGVGYNFTYAINFARDLSSNTIQTQYPTHYTYNFLNSGADNGSFYFDGWEIINANGCPNVETYGGTLAAKGLTGWMSGYDSYYNGMKNRVLESFTVDVKTPEGLETLKAWMNDQLNGSAVGGLANFSAGVSGSFSLKTLPIGTPEEYKIVVTRWDSDVNHAMTFVGYNDNIRYDFNGDGLYTNDKDINYDGKIDMKDWEIGGLIMVNSWGISFGNSGRAYVPYKLLAEPSTNGGIASGLVFVIRAKASYSPKVTLKATITHNSRNKLRITAGVSPDPNANRPTRTLQLPLFNFQGGSFYMKGSNAETDKTIEVGIDVTPLLSDINSGESAKFFLVVEEKDPNGIGTGKIVSYSLIDYTNGQNETVCQTANVNIEHNDTTFLTVNKAITFDKVQISTSTLPDATVGFPYSYSLNATNGTSPYSWDFMFDYSEKNTVSNYTPIANWKMTPNSADDGFAQLILPFSFPFYSNTYKSVLVSTDGSLLFGNSFEYVRDIPALMANKAITVYGTDLMLYPNDGDGIWYYSSKDSVIVRWRISKFEQQSFNADFSVTIFPSGQIKFNYGNGITPSTDWVAGISNGDGTSCNKISISGNSSITANYQTTLNSPSIPEGITINNNGEISFTPKQGNKDWTITAKATDLNKISTKKTFTLHSIKSLTISPDTLKFDNPLDIDPWQVGKDITISNVSSQDIVINRLDWEGLGWQINDSPITYPYTLNVGSSLTLKVKLKATISKSSSMIWDTLNIKTNYVTYPLMVLINPSIYTTSVYPVTFNITGSKGAVEGANISIDRLSSTLKTNSLGVASVNLPNGDYYYNISFKDHYPLSGSFTINGSTQNVNIYLTTVDVKSNLNNTLKIFPNPFSEEIIVNGIEEELDITLSGLLGNTLQSLKVSDNQVRIDTKSLKNGIYFISISNKKGQKIVRRLIK